MITLEQIEILDNRVRKAVELIAALRAENSALNEKLGTAENRIVELEGFVEELKTGQGRIENGINEMLNTLDFVEKTEDNPRPVTPSSQVKEEENSDDPETIPVQSEQPEQIVIETSTLVETPDETITLSLSEEENSTEINEEEPLTTEASSLPEISEEGTAETALETEEVPQELDIF